MEGQACGPNAMVKAGQRGNKIAHIKQEKDSLVFLSMFEIYRFIAHNRLFM
jgi:hypothetical protein